MYLCWFKTPQVSSDEVAEWLRRWTATCAIQAEIQWGLPAWVRIPSSSNFFFRGRLTYFSRIFFQRRTIDLFFQHNFLLHLGFETIQIERQFTKSKGYCDFRWHFRLSLLVATHTRVRVPSRTSSFHLLFAFRPLLPAEFVRGQGFKSIWIHWGLIVIGVFILVHLGRGRGGRGEGRAG